ncbi:hypothetical protein BD289DRAFT_451395 [Coniella lustricola]|uniref:Uncharacterized protein n=1 Tax=Coniella lustricola TaxID=2025994 RepID=A0A2T3AEY3_9PEZI|nr:hypothetical protein BD289DRAFT_451395 [Coniella lustricola]
MASSNEKSGATVTTSTVIVDKSSTVTTTTPLDTLAPAAFAVPTDNEPRRISEVSTPATAHNEGLNPFDTDLEAMVSSRTLMTADDSCGMKSATNTNSKGSPDCQVWPGKDHWKKKAKTARVNRHSCQVLAKMSKRNRIIVKVGIIALILAIALAVGLGVSKSLHARVWSPNDS